MTCAELQAEWDHRVTERLGILCEDRPPTPEQRQIARREADSWLARWHEEHDDRMLI